VHVTTFEGDSSVQGNPSSAVDASFYVMVTPWPSSDTECSRRGPGACVSGPRYIAQWINGIATDRSGLADPAQ